MIRAAPVGYIVIDLARTSDDDDLGYHANHDGIAFICRNSLTIRRLPINLSPTTFELLMCSVICSASTTIFITIYRPSSQVLSAKFFEELLGLFEIILLYKSSLVIVGDLNKHVDDLDDVHGKHFCDLLKSFGLLSQPTHARGHTLDLIVTRPDSDVLDLCIDPPLYSDHSFITCKFPFATRPARLFKQMAMRKWKKHDFAALSVIVSARLTGAAGMSAHELFQLYHHVLTDAVTLLAPLKVTAIRTALYPLGSMKNVLLCTV